MKEFVIFFLGYYLFNYEEIEEFTSESFVPLTIGGGINNIDDASKIIDEGVEKIGSMYVFTDPTCPYCQRVHEEISDYKSAGVEVNYIPYPRSGVDGGRDYETLKKIVCADDPEQAMTDFKNGTAGNKYSSVGGDQKCHDIVAAGYQAGQEVGVTGTPFIYLSNGQTIPGYNPSQAVIARFEQ